MFGHGAQQGFGKAQGRKNHYLCFLALAYRAKRTVPGERERLGCGDHRAVRDGRSTCGLLEEAGLINRCLGGMD
ncbi:uncharacterized protein sS8_0806 [Methylocaldum marinum]|uniref:Uncharacterized protein n=1 Tax=Methylocaldum marinum TaxID=1432792 RepID=A0A250KP70_9GAMM|nr:uncharacterized protein sS8_0806 [Methylocaldum marinum]